MADLILQICAIAYGRVSDLMFTVLTGTRKNFGAEGSAPQRDTAQTCVTTSAHPCPFQTKRGKTTRPSSHLMVGRVFLVQNELNAANNRKYPMKPLKSRCYLAIVGVLAATSTIAIAQSSSAVSWAESYYYVGIAGGEARSQFDEQRLVSSQLSPGVIGSGITGHDTRDGAWRIFGGYQFNRYWALELGYVDLGRFSFTSSIYPTGSLNGELKARGDTLDLVGTMPITDNFSIIGRIGANYSRTQSAFNGTGNAALVNGNPSNRKTNMKAGAGLQYAFSPNFMVRAEGERYQLNDPMGGKGYINTAMISLVFPFNRERVAPMRTAEPVYVAPQPTPQPQPVMVAPPPTVVAAPSPPPVPSKRRVTFSAETLFGFDKSTIRPEGMSALDTFIRDVQSTQYDVMTIEGHTDRLGTAAYNQKLSETRAATVKSYLVDTGRLEGSKIQIVGKSESMPVTKDGDCVGKSATKKLIACLQADRRVDVEVTGMR
jgi:OmpA-OmpF porin, OOP family